MTSTTTSRSAPSAVPAPPRARPRTPDLALLARGLDELEAAAKSRDTAATVRVLARLVPEYAPGAAPPAARATGD